ncbi:hypothetical protein [Cellulomonas cellasea]|uniref:EamA domain-containing protein n=2 Tax=Cellulomonas cellasea TaxID=43670 RepID=A0A0A0B4X8_9CELL|nr:hypothetical protein [Cellulomonas cellasea]KGM00859.1 hypothetical protein Q760_05595 [Cellulomonas cellasea DSM 20118]GEA88651.1 hypothetical protein CCE01nite_26000 [Cellulomonas cellasea]
MTTALLSVAAAALCSGAATVLQAVAARRQPVRAGIDVGLVLRLARSGTYWLAMLLVAAGFLLSFVALRTLPLFLVQAGRASSLAVAAVLSVLVLGARLRRGEVAALAVVAAGLVALAASVVPHPASHVRSGAGWWLVASVVVLAAAAGVAARSRPSTGSGLVLAGLAGLAFAVLAVAARTVGGLGLEGLVREPAAWAIPAGGALGLALGALALQRAPVVGVTAAMVGVETCVGALLGMLLAGDRPEPGSAVLCVVGFVAVLGGVLAVARFGSVEGATSPAGPLERVA